MLLINATLLLIGLLILRRVLKYKEQKHQFIFGSDGGGVMVTPVSSPAVSTLSETQADEPEPDNTQMQPAETLSAESEVVEEATPDRPEPKKTIKRERVEISPNQLSEVLTLESPLMGSVAKKRKASLNKPTHSPKKAVLQVENNPEYILLNLIVRGDQQLIKGQALSLILDRANMVYDPAEQCFIYQYGMETWFRLYNAVQPPKFSYEAFQQLETPGLLLMLRLPLRLPADSVKAFEQMRVVAKLIADAQELDICDRQRKLIMASGLDRMRSNIKRKYA